jgi:two-component system sensor histidine kinase BaeS
VPEEALPRLFDRLYRVDTSRNRDSGGSGLGLSICRHIIENHGGRIWAQRSPQGGLAIEIQLPLARKKNLTAA